MTPKLKGEWGYNVKRLATGRGNDKLFWRELDTKKVGLYGYHESISADPIALLRHPWSLKKNEFDSALQAVQDGNIPTLPDDREHVSAVLGAIAGVTGAAAVGAATSGIGAAAAPVLGGISAVTGGAAGAIAGVGDKIDNFHIDAFKSHIVQFRSIYATEAGYRRREAT